jgi:hypothetical protein
LSLAITEDDNQSSEGQHLPGEFDEDEGVVALVKAKKTTTPRLGRSTPTVQVGGLEDPSRATYQVRHHALFHDANLVTFYS